MLSDMQAGKAGEYLVCHDLIMKGAIAYPSEQGLPYDVILDMNGWLKKIQVKTTQKPRTVPQRNKTTKAYIFNIKRHGKNNTKKYTDNDVDIFALVALDTMQVSYLENYDMPSTLNLRVDSLRGSYYDEKGLLDFQLVSDLKEDGFSMREISNRAGVHYSTVSKMLKNGYEPHKTNARYMSELSRDMEWFYHV